LISQGKEAVKVNNFKNATSYRLTGSKIILNKCTPTTKTRSDDNSRQQTISEYSQIQLKGTNAARQNIHKITSQKSHKKPLAKTKFQAFCADRNCGESKANDPELQRTKGSITNRKKRANTAGSLLK
jgi:hypothetical protein